MPIDEMSADLEMPKEFLEAAVNSDPEFGKMIEEQDKASAPDEGGEDKGGEGDTGAEKPDEGNGDEIPPNGDENHDGEDKEPDDQGGADEKDPGESKEDSTDDEFADDVIAGLKGAHLKALPEEAQVALGEFYQTANAQKEQLDAAQARLSKIMSDPVIRLRAGAVEAGKQSPFDIRNLTDVEQAAIKKTFLDAGFDDQEATAAMSKLGGGIQTIAKQMAEDMAYKIVHEREQEQKAKETVNEGRKMLLGLKQFNKDLDIGDVDFDELYEKRESHPQWQKFNNGIGKIVNWSSSMGITYEKALKMGPKAFYAAAAAALDMPVRMNAADIDKKIAVKARLDALKPFRKGGQSKTLNPDGTNVERKTAEKMVMSGGFDVVKLATDPSYYESVVSRKPGDMQWFEKVNGLKEQGERTVAARSSKNRK